MSAVRDRVAGPAGAAMAVFAWNYHVLVRRHPGPGGAFAYAYEVLGPDYGFLVGWSLLLAYMAVLWANATALVLLVPKYLSGGALAAESYLMLALWAVLGFAVYRSVFKRERDRFGRTMAVWLGAMVLVFFSSLMWVRQVSTRAIRGNVDAIARFYHAQYRRLTGIDTFVSVLDGAEALENSAPPARAPSTCSSPTSRCPAWAAPNSSKPSAPTRPSANSRSSSSRRTTNSSTPKPSTASPAP